MLLSERPGQQSFACHYLGFGVDQYLLCSARRPGGIVIRLQVVDDRTLAKLAGMTVGSVPYNAIVLRSARQFTADVSLPPP